MPRPRLVPEHEAIDIALTLFWSRGYDRTSIADLSAALGLGPSSIYNAFGSKERLFRRAIERYEETHVAPWLALISEPHDGDPAELVRTLMRGLARVYTGDDTPPGCAIFESGGTASPRDSQAAIITQRPRDALRRDLRQRFVEARRAGHDLSATPATLAAAVVSALSGMSQLACDGGSRAQLLNVADHVASGVVRRTRSSGS
ncbi:MAG: TetR/AcrR family transcriptional regulator [Gemmatimonadota bacterium]